MCYKSGQEVTVREWTSTGNEPTTIIKLSGHINVSSCPVSLPASAWSLVQVSDLMREMSLCRNSQLAQTQWVSLEYWTTIGIHHITRFPQGSETPWKKEKKNKQNHWKPKRQKSGRTRECTAAAVCLHTIKLDQHSRMQWKGMYGLLPAAEDLWRVGCLLH